MRLERRARVLRDLVTGVAVVLALVLVLEVAGLAHGGGWRAFLFLHGALPVYLWAVWSVRQALAAIARGEAPYRVVGTMLGRVGAALAVGALLQVLGWPLLLRAWAGVGPLGFFDPSAITLGVVGFALALIARLVADAAELDEIV